MKRTHRQILAAIGLGIFSLSASVAQAQLSYVTTNGVITITGGCPSSPGAVTIPATINGLPVTSIGDYAFYDCPSLTSIVIPSSVISIGFKAFRGCQSLTSVVVDSANPNYSSLDGVLFNKDQTAPILFPEGKAGSYSIPNSVTYIPGGCPWGCVGAFAYCRNLTSVTIPNSVTYIGDFAYGFCTNLRAAYFQGNVPSVVGQVRPPFDEADNVTVYYLPGTTGWGSTFGGRPTAMWLPLMLDLPSGPPSTQLILHTTSPAPSQVRVQRSTNLIHWQDWQTVTKAAGPSTLQDAEAGTTPNRFYRGIQE